MAKKASMKDAVTPSTPAGDTHQRVVEANVTPASGNLTSRLNQEARPQKSKYDRRIMVYLSSAQYDELSAFCQERSYSLAGAIRVAIDVLLEQAPR